MSTHSPNVHLSESVLQALREVAEKRRKTLDQMPDEMVMMAISASTDHKKALLELMEFGRQKAEALGLADADDAKPVHEWRNENRSANR